MAHVIFLRLRGRCGTDWLGEAGELGVDSVVPEYLERCSGSAETERRLWSRRSDSREAGGWE